MIWMQRAATLEVSAGEAAINETLLRFAAVAQRRQRFKRWFCGTTAISAL
jgi:hypothetical protein